MFVYVLGANTEQSVSEVLVNSKISRKGFSSLEDQFEELSNSYTDFCKKKKVRKSNKVLKEFWTKKGLDANDPFKAYLLENGFKPVEFETV